MQHETSIERSSQVLPGHIEPDGKGTSARGTTGRTRSWLAEPPIRATIRLAAGLAFIIAGLTKLFRTIVLGTDLVHMRNGPPGFGDYLAAVGIPFPHLNAYLVLTIEILGGLGILLGIFFHFRKLLTRFLALALAGTMTVAIGLVGVPSLFGHPVMIQGIAVTNQFWRLPLELGLSACMMYLLARPVPPALRTKRAGASAKRRPG